MFTQYSPCLRSSQFVVISCLLRIMIVCRVECQTTTSSLGEGSIYDNIKVDYLTLKQSLYELGQQLNAQRDLIAALQQNQNIAGTRPSPAGNELLYEMAASPPTTPAEATAGSRRGAARDATTIPAVATTALAAMTFMTTPAAPPASTLSPAWWYQGASVAAGGGLA